MEAVLELEDEKREGKCESVKTPAAGPTVNLPTTMHEAEHDPGNVNFETKRCLTPSKPSESSDSRR